MIDSSVHPVQFLILIPFFIAFLLLFQGWLFQKAAALVGHEVSLLKATATSFLSGVAQTFVDLFVFCLAWNLSPDLAVSWPPHIAAWLVGTVMSLGILVMILDIEILDAIWVLLAFFFVQVFTMVIGIGSMGALFFLVLRIKLGM